MQYLGPLTIGSGTLASLGVDSLGTLVKVTNATTTTNGLMATTDKTKLDSILVDLTPAVATLTGYSWNGKPVYRQYFAGSFPSVGATVSLISGATALISYIGWVQRNNGQQHLISLVGVDSATSSHISPVFYTAGTIQLFNCAGEASFSTQPYQVSIDFTKT